MLKIIAVFFQSSLSWKTSSQASFFSVGLYAGRLYMEEDTIMYVRMGPAIVIFAQKI